jgi:hypothetical protein
VVVLPYVLPGLVALLGLLFFRGFFFGYPPRRFAARILNAREQAILSACAQAMFPDRDVMPLSGEEAGVVEFLDQHLFELPKPNRKLVRLLFVFVEHSPWLFWEPSRPFRRFSALDEKSRTAFLLGMAESRFYFRRVCFVSLRALLCMAYLAHPAIAARVGSTPNQHPFRGESSP